jgi:phage terminase large subunit GpA-like protein
VGPDAAKDAIYGSLSIETPGPSYCHVPSSYPARWFDQIVAERKRTVYRYGRPVRQWFLPPGKRNEALDCRVYALAAMINLGVDLNVLADDLGCPTGPAMSIADAAVQVQNAGEPEPKRSQPARRGFRRRGLRFRRKG